MVPAFFKLTLILMTQTIPDGVAVTTSLVAATQEQSLLPVYLLVGIVFIILIIILLKNK